MESSLRMNEPFILQFEGSWASLVAELVKNLPAVWGT